ncbi:MAG: hypothetical protein JO228_16360 [Xanthobacteraceae bacterium]|nr:hypothetical protein [Xanthobacteraceae bacterium]
MHPEADDDRGQAADVPIEALRADDAIAGGLLMEMQLGVTRVREVDAGRALTSSFVLPTDHHSIMMLCQVYRLRPEPFASVALGT